MASDALPLNGTGLGEKDPGLLLALARFGRQSCIVLTPARPLRRDAAGIGPDSLREARRGMKLAEELRLPLLTVIDTTGAALSREAEEGGLAGEVARPLHELIGLEAPSVSMLVGQGAGGGALAPLPADRTIAAGKLSPRCLSRGRAPPSTGPPRMLPPWRRHRGERRFPLCQWIGGPHRR